MWSYPCCPPRAASFEADLPGEKTNIDRGKECDCQGRTHNQHNRRRSIKKTRARLDRLSITASRSAPLSQPMGAQYVPARKS